MPNLVVLVIDGLQPAYLGPYGNTWVNTPAWNQLAAESLLLERCWLDAPGLPEFYRAAWSGQPSWLRHGVGGSGLGVGENSNASLPAALTAAGYRTILQSDDPLLAMLPGADDFAERIELPLDAPTEAAADWTETALARFFAAASDTLDGLHEPFALWLHTGLLGRVWDAPYDYRARFAEEDDPEPPEFIDPPSGVVPVNIDPDELLGVRQAYAGQIALLDECLHAFLEAWDNDPRARDTWFVVLGSRGYPLGEHGRWGWERSGFGGSGFGVGDNAKLPTPSDPAQACRLANPAFAGHELLHMPVIVRAPDRARATERAAILAQPCDLWATIAEGLNLTANETASAARWPTGSWWSAPLFTAEWPARDRMFIAASTAQAQLQTAQWWYAGRVVSDTESSDSDAENSERLYLLPEDYFGVNNVANRCGEEAAACAELLTAWQQARTAQDSSLALQPLPEILTQTVH